MMYRVKVETRQGTCWLKDTGLTEDASKARIFDTSETPLFLMSSFIGHMERYGATMWEVQEVGYASRAIKE